MLRSSWFNYAMAAPADPSARDELGAALSGNEAFLTEADTLGLEVSRYHYLKKRVEADRQAHVDAGGTFGEFRDGVFHEPLTTDFMEDVIDRQTLFRLHVLSMLEGREQAREAKVTKDAAKATDKAAKAARSHALAETPNETSR